MRANDLHPGRTDRMVGNRRSREMGMSDPTYVAQMTGALRLGKLFGSIHKVPRRQPFSRNNMREYI